MVTRVGEGYPSCGRSGAAEVRNVDALTGGRAARLLLVGRRSRSLRRINLVAQGNAFGNTRAVYRWPSKLSMRSTSSWVVSGGTMAPERIFFPVLATIEDRFSTSDTTSISLPLHVYRPLPVIGHQDVSRAVSRRARTDGSHKLIARHRATQHCRRLTALANQDSSRSAGTSAHR